MTEKLAEYEFGRDTNGKYPAEWFDGSIYRITNDHPSWDDDLPADKFLNRLASMARSRGLLIRTRRESSTSVVIQMTRKEGSQEGGG